MTGVWTHESEVYRWATRRDLRDFAELLSDPEVGRWLWFTPLPPEGVEAYFGPLLDQQLEVVEAGDSPQTAIFTVEDLVGKFLGHGAAVAVEGSPQGFEIGFQLMRHAWGRGVGGRLGRFLCAYAIERGEAYRIEGGCLKGNVASAALMRGLGLALEGSRPGYRSKQGVRHTELCFGAQTQHLDREVFSKVALQTGLRPATDSGSS